MGIERKNTLNVIYFMIYKEKNNNFKLINHAFNSKYLDQTVNFLCLIYLTQKKLWIEIDKNLSWVLGN